MFGTALKQGAWVALSKFIEKVLSFLIIVVASRKINSEGIGEFFFYFSTVSLLIPLMNLGLEKILIQKWAVLSEDDRKKLYSHLFVLKCLLGLGAWAGTLGLDYILRGQQANFLAVSTAFFAIFFDELGQLLRAPDRLAFNVRFEIAVPLISRSICFLSVLAFLPYLENGYQICIIYAVGNGIGALISLGGMRHFWPTHFETCTLAAFGQTINLGITFSFTTLFVMTSLYADSAILGRYSFAEVGLYNAAYRIILVFGLLSGGITHAFYPRIARWHSEHNWEKISHVFSLVISGFILLFGGIAAGCIIEGDNLMMRIYGEKFAASGAAFKILAFVIPLLSLTNLFGQSLEAMGMQRKTMRVCMLSSIFNVIANLIFIPIYGMYAAAVITVMTEMMSLTSLSLTLRNNVPVQFEFKLFGKGVLSLICAIVFFCVFHQFNLILAILLDGLSFCIILAIFKKRYLEKYFQTQKQGA